MTEAHPAVPCVDHPDLAAVRRCVVCSGNYCEYCGDPTLIPPPEKGYVVCKRCTKKVRPWVWNRFAAGKDKDPGAHLVQAILRPRIAALRAGYSSVPLGTMALVLWVGCLGAAWIGVDLAFGSDPTVVAAERFGLGLPWSLAGMAGLLAYGCALWAVQPAGPGLPATWVQALQVSSTAFLGPAALCLGAGLLALVSSGIFGTVIGVFAAAALAVAGVLWGIFGAGWGLAVRRGANPALGVASSLGALIATGVGVALVLVICANPPWGPAFEQTPF